MITRERGPAAAVAPGGRADEGAAAGSTTTARGGTSFERLNELRTRQDGTRMARNQPCTRFGTPQPAGWTWPDFAGRDRRAVGRPPEMLRLYQPGGTFPPRPDPCAQVSERLSLHRQGRTEVTFADLGGRTGWLRAEAATYPEQSTRIRDRVVGLLRPHGGAPGRLTGSAGRRRLRRWACSCAFLLLGGIFVLPWPGWSVRADGLQACRVRPVARGWARLLRPGRLLIGDAGTLATGAREAPGAARAALSTESSNPGNRSSSSSRRSRTYLHTP